MKRILFVMLISLVLCGFAEDEKDKDEELVYIPVVRATASSYDTTPDWAPEPSAIAAADGDMNTRWSSNYD